MEEICIVFCFLKATNIVKDNWIVWVYVPVIFRFAFLGGTGVELIGEVFYGEGYFGVYIWVFAHYAESWSLLVPLRSRSTIHCSNLLLE